MKVVCGSKCTAVVKQIAAVLGMMAGLCVSQSPTTTPSNDGTIRACGQQLADMLELVCAGRGFHFKRAASVKVDKPSKRSRWSGEDAVPTVVGECCQRRCSLSTLESYCAAGGEARNQPGGDLYQYLYGNQRRQTVPPSSTVYYPSTTVSSAHYDPNAPSAQVFRAPPAGSQGSSFFYVRTGSRPTRTPLIVK